MCKPLQDSYDGLSQVQAINDRSNRASTSTSPPVLRRAIHRGPSAALEQSDLKIKSSFLLIRVLKLHSDHVSEPPS